VRAAFTSAELSSGHWDLIQQPVPAELRDRNRYTSMNWCLYTALGAVGVLEEGQFEVLWL
jgi:hypothetical protein